MGHSFVLLKRWRHLSARPPLSGAVVTTERERSKPSLPGPGAEAGDRHHTSDCRGIQKEAPVASSVGYLAEAASQSTAILKRWLPCPWPSGFHRSVKDIRVVSR